MKTASLVSVALALLLLGAGGATAATNELPPMLLAGKPSRIVETSQGYTLTYPDGRSERWMRTASGYVGGGQRFFETASGFTGGGQRYTRSSNGWTVSGPTGSSHRIVTTASGVLVDGVRYSPTYYGYTASIRSTSPNPYAVAPRAPVHRMERSQPSAFRRSSE